MDAKIVLPDPKKQKVVCEMGTGKDEEDITSQLPDSILHHILSFRSTKRAVSTSILSKRWKDLWMSTTNLYFKDMEKLETKFTPFVDRVFRYHSSNITSFNLTSINDLDAIRVESWISAAVERQVQVIHLSTWLRARALSLPCCLCTSKVLRSLELSRCGNLQLPSTVWLPSLKNLRLAGLQFIDGLSFNRLFSGLPNIEELEINIFGWDNLKNVGISLPTLRRLRFVVGGGFLGSDIDVVIKVNTRNLQNLDCYSNLSINLIIENMPSLDEAKIQFPYQRRKVLNTQIGAAAQHAANLLGGLCCAKSIKIAEGVEYLHEYSKLVNINLVPEFVNLTSLELDLRVTSFAAALVITIFKNAPLLESLVLKEVYGGKWSIKPYPHCIEFSLKSCSLSGFDCRRAEILFVKFLIKAAKVLEKLKIQCSSSQQEKFGDVKHMLQTLPRASKSCVIEFL